jgi:G patch domain-containing protein 1
MSSGTARLKRRLDEQGINYTNKKAVENFCLVRSSAQCFDLRGFNLPLTQIGTPLPPLEKKDANEFVPIWKQDVCTTDCPSLFPLRM